MSIEALWNPDLLPPCDLYGILVAETQMCGIVNNHPLRSTAVPFLTFQLYQSNNRRLRVYVRSPDGDIINLTGATCVFSVKLTKGDASTVIQKSTAVPGEGMIGSADQGECFFYILPADTSALDIAQYVFDIGVTLSDGSFYTVVDGVLNLLKPIGV